MTRQGHLALFFLFLVVSPLGWASTIGQRRRSDDSSQEVVGRQQQQQQDGSFEQGQRRRQQQQQQSGSGEFDQRGTSGRSEKAKPFRGGYEYTFTYNGQISQGLNQDPSASGNPPQQKSAARIQAQVKIEFHSDRHAQLRLGKIRIGHLNDRIQNPQQVQPMGMFEQKQIEDSQLSLLQLPCQFSYADGVVERIDFQQEDIAWSKNIKRSVLNMIQLNLKKNNAQGLRTSDELSSGPQVDKLPEGQQLQQQRWNRR
jgi:hypothetical protein